VTRKEFEMQLESLKIYSGWGKQLVVGRICWSGKF